MSCYNWETATLKLPTATWPSFKKGLQDGFKKMVEQDQELALKLHATLTEQKKGKRGFDLKKAFEEEVEKTSSVKTYSFMRGGSPTQVYPFKVMDRYQIKEIVLGKGPDFKLRKPQKKDFPVCSSKTLSFTEDELGIHLDNTSKQVSYNSGENNRAVEHARETHLAKLFFSLLAKVKWTRGTGGTFIGNDEYNREAAYEGGGGNYVTQRFGPLGEPAPCPFRQVRKKPGVKPGSRASK